MITPDTKRAKLIRAEKAFMDRELKALNKRYEAEKARLHVRYVAEREAIQVIYAAGDADREGEVIVRLVIDNNLRNPKNILRLWLPAPTPEAIREGIREAKPAEDYETLYQAGRTRAFVDWLMGIELTRYATLKAGAFVRIGRCVCPIVSRIVEREKEIQNFLPEKYLAAVSKTEIDGVVLELTGAKTFVLTYQDATEGYAKECNEAGAVVTKVKKTCGIVKSGRLFSMSDLQSFLCRRNKSLTPSDVLETVQSLYEKGFVTYPRTSSNFLCEGEHGRILATIRAFEREGISGLCGKKGDKGIYDDSKVESHSALTPTDRIPAGLSGTEKEVYEAIRNRLFAVFQRRRTVFMELSWNKSRKDYEGTYQVGVKGKLGDGKAIRIIPDAEFQMTSGKKTRKGSVKQEHTRWAMSAGDKETLVLSDKAYVTTTGTAAIKLPGSGTYRGGIQLTFSVE